MLLSYNNTVKKIFLALIITTIISVSNANPFKQHEVYVTVKNALGSKLLAHCWSTEDDVGTHVLENGQSFGWHFRPNVWGSTKFRCYLQSQSKSGEYLLYSFRRDDDFCGEKCVYNITPEGICLQNDQGKQTCRKWV